MSFDNLCKLLAEKYPDRFAAWILGETSASVTVLKAELSIEPIRADSVTFLPLAPLAATAKPEDLLNRVAQQVTRIESAQERQTLSAYVQLLD